MMKIMKKTHKILILIPYFGHWPEWFPLFFETIKANSKIDFHFFTDCKTENINAKNVSYDKISFEDYVRFAQKSIPTPINIPNPYKICDLRPLFGLIHENIIKDYDYYGWMDIDIILGDILSFYTIDILNSYNVYSTHSDRISGHFALFKNNRKNKYIFQKIYKWKEALNNPNFVGIDEHGITNAYTEIMFDKIRDKFKIDLANPVSRWYKKFKARKMYLVEQYTTPFLPKPWLDGSINSEQPSIWTYRNGVIRNNRDDRNFMYLHFMNYKSSKWRHDGTKAPWEDKVSIYHIQPQDISAGIQIDLKGINRII